MLFRHDQPSQIVIEVDADVDCREPRLHSMCSSGPGLRERSLTSHRSSWAGKLLCSVLQHSRPPSTFITARFPATVPKTPSLRRTVSAKLHSKAAAQVLQMKPTRPRRREVARLLEPGAQSRGLRPSVAPHFVHQPWSARVFGVHRSELGVVQRANAPSGERVEEASLTSSTSAFLTSGGK